MGTARISLMDKIASSSSQHITLLGSIATDFPESLVGLPISYKGVEYSVSDKGDIELYDNEKPLELYIIITEYLKKPDENSIKHHETSPDHPYLYYKLTKITKELSQPQKTESARLLSPTEYQDTWHIEQLDNTAQSMVIPDNTVIIIFDAALVEGLQEVAWPAHNTSLRLPTVVLKPFANGAALKNVVHRMKCGFGIDFKCMHKRPYRAYMPCGTNHLLSMPFRPRGYC
jgi:hypothetical protein